MSKAKSQDDNGKQKAESIINPPPQAYSKFGKGPAFGFQNVSNNKGQFRPPTIRITQNKGGGGK